MRLANRRGIQDRRGGCTLVELLIVIAVLVLLGALVVPTFDRAAQMSRKTICSGNLHHLGGMLYIIGYEQDRAKPQPRLPVPTGWDFDIHDKGASDYLYCVSNESREPSMAGSLRDVYIRQFATGSNNETEGKFISYLSDIFVDGYVLDTQLHYIYQGEGNGPYDSWDWVYALNGGPPKENEALISIATCAAMRVTFTDNYIEYTPLGHAPHWNSGSSHWLARGDPEDDDGWMPDVMVRLTGVGYEEVNDPVRTKVVEETDYGMNSLIHPAKYAPDQILLVEYSHATVWIDGPLMHEPFDGDSENGEVEARHLGLANLLLVDGSVMAMGKDELQAEYDKIGTDERSMWERE